jgi:hypothetical protein
MFPEFNQSNDAVPYNHLSQSIPQKSANSYDWNNAHYGADLVSESYQFTNSAGSVIDQNFAFITANPHKRLRRRHDSDYDDDDDDNYTIRDWCISFLYLACKG